MKSSPPTILLSTVGVSGGHGRFVGGDDFMGGAVLANGGGVNPDDAMAEAADLIELMGDEDDGAAGACDVTHFAHALLLKTDVADGEDFIHSGNFPLELC